MRIPAARHPAIVRFGAALLCAAAALTARQAAAADTWPDHPIRLIAPSAPGGATDSVGRILGRFLEKRYRQNILVEAKPGAGTIIGVQYVKASAPDGYTFLISGSSTHSANPFLYSHLPYDPSKDFRDVGMVGFIPEIGLVRADLSIRSTADLIGYAKSHPGKLSYGYATSSSQVPPAIIKSRAGIDMLGVSYKSLAQIITDLAGGQIDIAFLDIMSAGPALHYKAIVAIATTSPQRVPSLPNVPTVGETLPGYEVRSWIGLAAPAGTPDAIVKQMNEELAAALADPETRQALERLSMTVQAYSLDEMSRFVRADRQRWKEWVQTAGIPPIQ